MLGKMLREMRKNAQLTQSDVANLLGVTQQAVGKWEKEAASPDPETLLRLAGIFNVSVDELLGRPGVVEIQPEILVPILGTVRAGYGALAYEEEQGREPANVRDPESYFYLLVKGDSMEPRIQNGDLALVRRQPVLDDGDLGVVVFGQGEGTLKLFRRKGNAVVLQPFNPAYESVILSGEELDHLYIAGKVVETRARW